MAATAVYCAGLGVGGSGRESPGPWLPQAFRASARVRGAAGVCAYPAQAPPSGGNGGGAAASGSAAGDDLYGVGLGVPATLGLMSTERSYTICAYLQCEGAWREVVTTALFVRR